jgi:hypothetical protein
MSQFSPLRMSGSYFALSTVDKAKAAVAVAKALLDNRPRQWPCGTRD